MARKKKTERNVYELDLSRLSLSEDKYVSQMRQYLEENISDCEISKDGSTLKVEVPSKFNQRMFKHRADKFLYQAGLKLEYRLVSLQNEGRKGFQIMNR